jgi:hypothetical protein
VPGDHKHRNTLHAKIRAHIQTLKEASPCLDCWQYYPHYVMQFDHVHGEKLFNIGNTHCWTSWSKVLAEIEKCEIVCANCHAARTYTRALAG